MALTQESALRKDKRSAQFANVDGMQHRHFAVIAGVLAQLKPSDTKAFEEPWKETVLAFVDKLNECNPRFDRTRFLRACGWQK